MSAALAPVLDAPRRNFPRHPINVPLDLIALRFGVPEDLPGRCIDISETGVGAVVAGELAVGQQIAVELRLPNVGVPVRARAVVRYQSRLRCGVEFVGLSVEQREMIRYWIYRRAEQPLHLEKKEEDAGAGKREAPVLVTQPPSRSKRRVRIGRRGAVVLAVCVVVVAALGWWQWQKSWNELETRVQAAESELRISPQTVSAETMEKRIVTKVEPVYPEAARTAGTEGLVVLDAVIAADGSVKSLRPVSGPGLLVQSAIAAVKFWKFEPYLSNGSAVEVETAIAVEFRLH